MTGISRRDSSVVSGGSSAMPERPDQASFGKHPRIGRRAACEALGVHPDTSEMRIRQAEIKSILSKLDVDDYSFKHYGISVETAYEIESALRFTHFHVGFTGTSIADKISETRKEVLRSFLTTLALMQPFMFHHGDCIGADEIAHGIAQDIQMEITPINITIHPPTNSYKRAYCRGALDVYQPHDFLVRNMHIVNECSLIIGMPVDEHSEVLRSGTWSTVRYARKSAKKVVLI